jgi:hypothetical protein
MALEAGASQVRITPPVGVDLSGYGDREGPSIKVHDDLWCRAVMLRDGAAYLAVVSLDVLGLDFPLDAAIRQQVSRASGLNPEHLLLNCSHTHAGPAVASAYPVPPPWVSRGLGLALGGPDEGYVATLPALVAEAVVAASQRLAPAAAAFGVAPARVGINRREHRPDGTVVLGRNPRGLRDESVRVLQVSDPRAEPIALLFSHACHGTTLGGENREISAEWMGAACLELQARLKSGAIPMFLQGCCGNINPDREERSFQQVARHGAAMAEAVLAAVRTAQPVSGEALRARLMQVQLPLQNAPGPAAARAELARAEAELARAKQVGQHPYRVRTRAELVHYWQGVLSLAERGARELKLPFAVQAMAIGDVALVGLSGEVFLEFAHQIAAASPFRHTVVLGYSNGCTGYVPTAEAIAEGGYEPDQSFRYYGTLPLAPEAGEEMVAGTVGLLRELHRS